MRLKNLTRLFLKKVVLPQSSDKDQARRIFILNILLLGLIVLSAIALTINLIDPILYPHARSTSTPLVTGGIFVFFCLLLFLSRKGKTYIAAHLFVFSLLVLGVYENYYWGSDLAVVLLLFALTVVIAGIIIGTRYAFAVTFITSSSILLFTYLQIAGITHPNISRKTEMIHMTDSVVHVILLLLIALVSWLFNRDLVKALRRARSSEAALKKERDLLEIKVEERTKQLKQTQLEKMVQLYRFAEFGRITGGLFHDLVNPLSLVSLNLDRLNTESKKLSKQDLTDTTVLLNRAIKGTRSLEKFIQAARKHIQHQEIMNTFSLQHEITQVIQMLSHKAKEARVKITFIHTGDVKTFADPMKFNQIVLNLIANSIDAYSTKPTPEKDEQIIVTLKKYTRSAKITVQDWANVIPKEHLNKIFDPFFTTKSAEKGIGIGLYITRDIVEKSFHGKIHAESSKKIGTTFIITLPITQAPSGMIKREVKNL